MSSKKASKLTATKFRYVLIGVLVLTLLAIGGGFYVAYTSLRTTAEETAMVQSEADSSDAKIQNLLNTKATLKKNADVVKRAEQIVSDSQNYQYQDQIISDLNAYASKSGLSIKSFTFQPGASSGNSAATTPASPATPPAASGGSVKSVIVGVELSGAITYESLLKFLNMIEQNLTRMQVTSISLSGDSKESSSQTLNIEVYVR